MADVNIFPALIAHCKEYGYIFSLQVLDGKVRLHSSEKTINVNEDELFVLHANIPYKIEAVKKSIFLLTVIE